MSKNDAKKRATDRWGLCTAGGNARMARASSQTYVFRAIFGTSEKRNRRVFRKDYNTHPFDRATTSTPPTPHTDRARYSALYPA